MNVAQIGCGKQGQRRMSVCRPIAWYDPMCAAAPWGGAMESAEAVITAPGVEAVIVSTPHKFLAETAILALHHGKHVFLEKPGAMNVEELARVQDAATAAGKVVRVGFTLRQHPAVREFIRALQDKTLLELRMVYANEGGSPWRKEQGGVSLDLGVHLTNIKAALPPCESGNIAVSADEPGNLFRLEAVEKYGKHVVEGLGGHYGPESYTYISRSHTAPILKRTWPQAAIDRVWKQEWELFEHDVETGEALLATLDDARMAIEGLGRWDR